MRKALLAILSGSFQLLLPRHALAATGRVLLAGYENPGDLTPKDWYVKAVRVQGAVSILVGVIGLVKRRYEQPDE
ncbi:hypothetical protein BRC71_10920 [Halobacteriales archaeon QH_7_65_31]|nr:MAG: hypothetical protein BRC71_10920 [Halobacteriales archaeon QH_7_65_31]